MLKTLISIFIDFGGLIFTAPGALDVAIAIDSAQAITQNNWNQMIKFVTSFVNRFPNISPNPDGTRFSVISYAAKPAVHFNFKTLQKAQLNAKRVVQMIQRTPRQAGTERRMDAAMQMVETDLFSSKGGARIGAGRVIIFDI
jgi:hypothetical protein